MADRSVGTTGFLRFVASDTDALWLRERLTFGCAHHNFDAAIGTLLFD